MLPGLLGLATLWSPGPAVATPPESPVFPGSQLLQEPAEGTTPIQPPPELPMLLAPAESLKPTPVAAAEAFRPVAQRSPQLESIAQEADRHSRRAFELAARGANFAARAEFITALRLLAQGLDAERHTSVHSRALSAGLAALDEAEDFLPGGRRLDADASVAEIVRGHRTPALQGIETARIAPLEAMQCYLTFAQEQLALAAGGEVAGSMALHGLGKLHGTLAAQSAAPLKAAHSKAVVCYQAALLAMPGNYLASNDLGVLLARGGQFREARIALEHSLSLRPQSAGWHNLAVVYRQLGQTDLARRAEHLMQLAQQSEAATRGGKTPTGLAVEWVDGATFAQSFADTPAARQPLPARPSPAVPSQAASSKGFARTLQPSEVRK